MSRRIPALALLVVGLLLTAAACSSNATGPSPVRADATCDWTNGSTCK